MPQTFAFFYNRSKHSLKVLPSLFHLVLFITVVLLGVLSLNLEVFRVMRIGDLLLLLAALIVGIHWYGQKMLETGYKEGIAHTHEDTFSTPRK